MWPSSGSGRHITLPCEEGLAILSSARGCGETVVLGVVCLDLESSRINHLEAQENEITWTQRLRGWEPLGYPTVGLMTWVVMGSTRKKTREASSQLQMLNLVLAVCTCYNGWRLLTGTIGVQSCGDSASGPGNPLVMLFITTYLYIFIYIII